MSEISSFRYTVLQNVQDKDLCQYLNTHGHDATAEAFPAHATHLALRSKPADNWKPEMLAHYKVVGFIEADHLEHAYEIGNGMGANARDRVLRRPEMTSLSVTDILRDNHDGSLHLVLPVGWQAIEGDALTVGLLDQSLGAHANRAPHGPAMR